MRSSQRSVAKFELRLTVARGGSHPSPLQLMPRGRLRTRPSSTGLRRQLRMMRTGDGTHASSMTAIVR